MRRPRWIGGRWRRVDARIASEIEDEIRFHLRMRAEANVRAGMDPAQAQRAAERSFGDVERVRRAGRQILAGGSEPPSPRWWQGLGRDVRFALRMLRRSPLPTAVALLSLGLGIGANTANFSIVHGILFRPLPFADADRIVYLDAVNPERSVQEGAFTWADLMAMRETAVFSAVGAFDTRSVTVTGDERPERIAAAHVSPELFPMLGVRPTLGRTFHPDEGAEAGFEQVVLISDGLWKRMFGADPGILGRPLHLNGRELLVVGVMEPGFRFPEIEDLWLPLGRDDPTDRAARFLVGAAKLAPGATLAQAGQALDAISARAEADHPDSHRGWALHVQPFRHGFVDPMGRQMMVLLLAAVGFVLLLACANVANLLLARATERSRELAVRNALGAGRGRLIRQMLTESVLLALGGGIIGAVIADVWVAVLVRSVPEELAYWMDVRIDASILLYAAAISVATGLLFGALPALHASRADPGAFLAEAGRGGTGTAGGRLRAILVTGEVALAVVLLVAATLMTRSFLELQVADPGFDDRPLLSARIALSGDQYDEPAARAELFRALNERIEALPAGRAAVLTSAIPADDGGPPVAILPVGADRAADESLQVTGVLSTDGLYEALGVDLLAGRDFTASEAADPGARVAIVGVSLAEALWGRAAAVGQVIRSADLGGDYTVIGVAPDVKYEEFGEGSRRDVLQLHLPYALVSWRGMALLVRGDGDPATLIDPVRDALVALDSTQALYDVLTMRERRAFTTWPQRVFGQSFGIFGAIALVLAFSGVYAVIAYSVSRRTREMGVRIAIGARPSDVRRQVMAGALRMAGLGLAIGLLGGLGFARALGGLLYGVSSTEPSVFLGVALLLAAAAALAAWLPALRASSVDPTEALRAE